MLSTHGQPLAMQYEQPQQQQMTAVESLVRKMLAFPCMSDTGQPRPEATTQIPVVPAG